MNNNKPSKYSSSSSNGHFLQLELRWCLNSMARFDDFQLHQIDNHFLSDFQLEKGQNIQITHKHFFSFDIILNTYYSIEIDACFAIIGATEQNSCCDFHYHLQYTTKNTIISIYSVLLEEKFFLFLLQIGFRPGINQL